MIRGIVFDLNGTIINILTDEGCDHAYRVVSNFLIYSGIATSPDAVRDFYFDAGKRQRRESAEEYPEFDVVRVFNLLIKYCRPVNGGTIDRKKRYKLARCAALLFRAATLYRLELYPDVKRVLDALSQNHRLAAVSDGQRCWAEPEAAAVGVIGYFNPMIISGDYGFRKPDRRMFQFALDRMKLSPDEALFVGNDMFRDVWGAKALGIRTIFFRSNQGGQHHADTEPDYVINSFSELPEAVAYLAAAANGNPG